MIIAGLVGSHQQEPGPNRVSHMSPLLKFPLLYNLPHSIFPPPFFFIHPLLPSYFNSRSNTWTELFLLLEGIRLNHLNTIFKKTDILYWYAYI